MIIGRFQQLQYGAVYPVRRYVQWASRQSEFDYSV